MQKRCLIISYGPVPTPEHQTVEGGGMRAWGLAKGLQANGTEATVAISANFPLSLDSHDGIKLIAWKLDTEFIKMMNSYDAVIVSYCMGDVSVFVADNISDDTQLILDCYVPIYIEVSARDAKDMDVEYVNYMSDLRRHNRTLKRGDYFLYANPAQEQLYSGVLSALGIINPYSYRNTRLIYAPFGIHRDAITTSANPYSDIGIQEDDFVVLWFGGIYPWFRIEEYLDAIKKLSSSKKLKFVFVGGKNPFNANEDIARQYNKTVEFAHTNKLFDKNMHFVDWVDFDTRINWFRGANVIISLNQPGAENKYSWRTRVMDFVWGEAATITNGGDPLSEEMIINNAALRLDSLSASAIADSIEQLQQHPKQLKQIQANVKKLKNKYYWDVTTSEIKDVIEKNTHPYKDESNLRQLAGLDGDPSVSPIANSSKLHKVAKLPVKVVRKIRQKGLKSTSKVAFDIITTQARQRINAKREKQFVFISHPIDNTGAPAVLLQMVEEYVDKYGSSRVRVFAPGITKNQENVLKSHGIKVEKAVYGASFRFIRLQLGLQSDDVVIMNTIAIYDSYRDFILLWLKIGKLKKAYWFIHEDPAQISIINPGFLSSENINRIKSLTETQKLTLLYPSQRTCDEYKKILSTNAGSLINLQVSVNEKYRKDRSEKDFETINILLSGTSSDGRKGQLLALSALQEFLDKHYQGNQATYRKVHLHLVAVTDSDYISQQVRWIAQSALSDYVSVYKPMPKEDAMEISSRCNTVLCCSLNETFGLYIAEGMLMGHIVLRNSSAGVDEQLQEGKNGYLIDHTDIKSISAAIEKIANKSSLSNRELLKMSKKSKNIMTEFTKHSYLEQIDVL